jgi:hypothetical protein
LLTRPLTDAATITSNGALGTKVSVTLGAATRTLAFPTNVVPGQALTYVLTTSTTSTALTLASGFKTAGGAPTATATAAAIDVWTGWVDNTGTAALGQYLKAFA